MPPFGYHQSIVFEKQVGQIEFVVDDLALQFEHILAKGAQQYFQLLAAVRLQLFEQRTRVDPKMRRVELIRLDFIELILQRHIHSCLECDCVDPTLLPDAWHIMRHHFELSRQHRLPSLLELLQSADGMPILQYNVHSNDLVFKGLYSCLSRLHLRIQILRKYARRTEVERSAGETTPQHTLIMLFHLLAIFGQLTDRRQNMRLLLLIFMLEIRQDCHFVFVGAVIGIGLDGAVIGTGLDGSELAPIFNSFGHTIVFVVSGPAEESGCLLEGYLSLEVVIDQIFDDFCFVFMFTFGLGTRISHKSMCGDVVFGVVERE